MWFLAFLELIAGLGQLAAGEKRYRVAAILYFIVALVFFSPALFGLSIGNVWGVVIFGLLASPFAALSWMAWRRADEAREGAP